MDGWKNSPAIDCPTNAIWKAILKIVTREKGVFGLTQNERDNPVAQCIGCILSGSTSDVIDLIEVAFCMVDTEARGLTPYYRRMSGVTQVSDDAIAELNARLLEHGIGYEFTNGELVRVDSRYIHTEAVKPALALLHGAGKGFAGPLHEFLDAHGKYRKDEHKEAIAGALKAFESTLKAICTARRWPFDPTKDTASKLVEIVFAHNLIPNHLQNQFTALRSVMESGVPTVRNKTPGSGHGQGPTHVPVPKHLARYVLNLAATNIVFMIESHNAML